MFLKYQQSYKNHQNCIIVSCWGAKSWQRSHLDQFRVYFLWNEAILDPEAAVRLRASFPRLQRLGRTLIHRDYNFVCSPPVMHTQCKSSAEVTVQLQCKENNEGIWNSFCSAQLLLVQKGNWWAMLNLGSNSGTVLRLSSVLQDQGNHGADWRLKSPVHWSPISMLGKMISV